MIKVKLNAVLTIRFKVLLITTLIIFFSFERVLITYWPIMGYFDEIFFVIILFEIFLTLLQQKKKYIRRECICLFCMMALFLIGIGGNYVYAILKDPFLILVDVISIFKISLCYFWVRIKNLSNSEWDQILKALAKIFRILVLVILCTYFLAYTKNWDMFEGKRYGIRSFKFFFNTAGNFSKLFYVMIPVLSVDLYYHNSFRKKLFIAIALFIWLTTLRSRAVAFVICYTLFSFWFFKLKGRRHRVQFYHLLPVGLVGFLIGWKQILFYFTTETQTRYQLLKFGIITLMKFFPIGSGFGTYGSDVAAKIYSPLYTEYGFKDIYGMGRAHTHFLNDNYWPMIMGQFGIIGTILVVIILYEFYRTVLQFTKKNEFMYFATLLLSGFLLISSIASKSYCEYSMIPVFILHGVLVQREYTKTL